MNQNFIPYGDKLFSFVLIYHIFKNSFIHWWTFRVVSMFWLLWLELLGIPVYRYLFEYPCSFLSGISLGEELPGHVLTLFHFLRHCSPAAASLYILAPTSCPSLGCSSWLVKGWGWVSFPKQRDPFAKRTFRQNPSLFSRQRKPLGAECGVPGSHIKETLGGLRRNRVWNPLANLTLWEVNSKCLTLAQRPARAHSLAFKIMCENSTLFLLSMLAFPRIFTSILFAVRESNHSKSTLKDLWGPKEPLFTRIEYSWTK